MKIITHNPQRGSPYNDQFENAISLQYEPNFPLNTVIQTIRRGYLFNQTVLRPAEVLLSTNKHPTPQAGRLQMFLSHLKRIFVRKK